MDHKLLQIENRDLVSEVPLLECVPEFKKSSQPIGPILLYDSPSVNPPMPRYSSPMPSLVAPQFTEHAEGNPALMENPRRKLVAILIADVVGYCRLMYEDEVATVSRLNSYKRIMIRLIETNRGRIVDAPGDSLMAEFPSVIDATQCAVAVQNRFAQLNRDLPEDRKMEFRIGINIGDVIDLGDQIYGDAVNITDRLQTMADPGGVCISRTVYDQIEYKLKLRYDFLGVREVKNIPKPVSAYRIVLECKETPPIKLERRPQGISNKDRKTGKTSARKLLANTGSFFTALLRCSAVP
jgi:class 3 adenylate cyclase